MSVYTRTVVCSRKVVQHGRDGAQNTAPLLKTACATTVPNVLERCAESADLHGSSFHSRIIPQRNHKQAALISAFLHRPFAWHALCRAPLTNRVDIC